jgi:uncharacterized protein YjcR
MTTIQERTRIIELSAQGMKAPEIAAQLGCSVWTARKWKQQFKKKVRSVQKWDAHRGMFVGV